VPNTAKCGKVAESVCLAGIRHPSALRVVGTYPQVSGMGASPPTGIIWVVAGELSLQATWEPASVALRFRRQEAPSGSALETLRVLYSTLLIYKNISLSTWCIYYRLATFKLDDAESINETIFMYAAPLKPYHFIE
jgi:hypothetical protein